MKKNRSIEQYYFDIYEATGRGYENTWFTNNHCRYRVLKGARNTKKSYVIIGLEVLSKIFSDPRRNVVILRNTQSSQKYSTFSTLQMLVHMPNIRHPEISFDRYFRFNTNDLTITYLPTGQVILFRGFDDPQKLQGIRVARGYITDVYVEEAFEITDYDAWRKFDGSIRGILPDGLFHQITFCFNAWNQDHWLYEHFFSGRMEDDVEYLETRDSMEWCDPNLILDYGKGLYLQTTTYKINEFRDKEIYDKAMQELRARAYEIYKVEALGCWGNATEATYPEFSDVLVKSRQEINNMDYACYCLGIDTGLSDGEGRVKRGNNVKIRSATTMQLIGLTSDYGKVCCINEYFHSNEISMIKKTEPELMTDIVNKIIEWINLYRDHRDLMKGTILVFVDSADKGFRQGLELKAREKGLVDVKFLPSTKIAIQTRVDFIRLIMAYGEYLISEACPNLIREIRSARRSPKGRVREDVNDHAINANEYAWQPVINRLRRWKTFKER